MKTFLAFLSFVSSLCYCLQLQLSSCTDAASKCSGNGSIFNQTTQICECGAGSQHMWGNKCQYGRIRLTSQSGRIIETEQEYHANSKYMFLIDSNTSYLPIRMKINEFITECNWDYLHIYDGISTRAPLLAALNGRIASRKYNKSRTITSTSGATFLYFYTDQCTSDDGFDISYDISTCMHVDCNNHGICNATGHCMCDPGWAGTNCTFYECCDTYYSINSKSKHCKVCSNPVSETMIKRASHGVTITQSNLMWIYGGISSINSKNAGYRETLNRIQLFDIKERKWFAIDKHSSYSLTEMRYGHSLVEYGGSLYVYGGTVYAEVTYEKSSITNDLLEFKTSTNSWEKPENGGIPVTGHAAVIVLDHMYIFFGYNQNYTYVNQVQKLKLSQSKKTWIIVNTKGALVKGRAGHSATYDQATNTVYIFGGYSLKIPRTIYNMEQNLLMFDVANEKWIIGTPAPTTRALHTAGIIANNLVIFGGNSNIRSHERSSCFNSDLLIYSLDCKRWLQKSISIMDKEVRYGHSSVMVNNSLIIFGGFNGEFLNDVFEIKIGDICSKFLLEQDCLNVDLLSGCVWHKPTSKCIKPTPNIPESSIVKPQCPENKPKCGEIPTCAFCSASPSCYWLNLKKGNCDIKSSGSFQVANPEDCGDYEEAKCNMFDSCFSCHLQPKCNWNFNRGSSSSWCSYAVKPNQAQCFGNSNVTSCHQFDTCSSCLQTTECLWCESTQMCLPRSMYIVNFPYGQCEEYVQEKSTCPATKCETQYSCRSCLQLPDCGWCDGYDGGIGKCMPGSDDAPFTNTTCPSNKWMFTECPRCHCNGQSICSNGTDVCISCNKNVIGKHCDRCAKGYFGNPMNNGTCDKECVCNGHLHDCDIEGKCSCNAQGVKGDHCDRCALGYYGDPRNGGVCFYPLQANYEYTTKMQKQVLAGYVLVPDKEKQSYNVEVLKVKGPTGYLNLTIVYANNRTTSLASAYPLGQFKTKITEDTYEHSHGASIQAVVYGWKNEDGVFELKIQFRSNAQLFDLVYFLIMFIVCFVSLLVILMVLWKLKQRYDRYIYHRRQKQEQEERINRPFTNIKINLNEKRSSEGYAGKKKLPTLLGMQTLRQANQCGPASFLVQLPRDHRTNFTPAGQCGLCIGTVLVTHSQKRTKTQVRHSFNREKTKAIPV